MKSKGFTLIELLGVIIILSLLMLLVLPNIVNSIKSSSHKIDEITRKLVYNATDLYIDSNKDSFKKSEGSVYCVSFSDLVEFGYLKSPILSSDNETDLTNLKTVKIIYLNDQFSYEVIDKDECKIIIDVPTDSDCFLTTENADGTLTITDYTCEYTDVVIPDTINGKIVTVIGYHAFHRNEIREINIPNSVISIDHGAFAENKITEIKFPTDSNLQYIGSWAFESNEIREINIPNSVISIDDCAFQGNKITEIKFPNSLKSIGSHAFNSNKIREINIPNSVTYIGAGAFINNECYENNRYIYNRKSDGSIDYTSLNSHCRSSLLSEKLNIPETITHIGDYAFGYLPSPEIIFPQNLVSIGAGAFSGIDLGDTIIPKTVTYIGDGAFTKARFSTGVEFIYNRKSDGSIDYTSLNSYVGTSLNVVIPEGVKKIGGHSFYSTDIESVVIPETVEEIGERAFSYNELTSIKIPNSVTSIGDWAFSRNELTSVIIEGKNDPSDFTEYGSDMWTFAFADGYSYKDVTWMGKTSICLSDEEFENQYLKNISYKYDLEYSYSDGNYYTFKINTVPNSIKDLYDKYNSMDDPSSLIAELNHLSDSDLRDISEIFNYLYKDIYKYNDNKVCQYDEPVIDLYVHPLSAPVAIYASNFYEGPKYDGLFDIGFNLHA